MKLTLDPGAATLLDALHAAGYAAYAVGGCVRDSLLGRTAHDWDLCTSALPQQVMELFGAEQCIPTGLQHGTVTIKYGGQLYETTTFRTEGSYTEGRHPDAVQFVPDVREDLARRDFTINAMAYNEAEGLVDPFGGQKDLQNGLLRAVGEPQQRFTEDALRILRLYRFAARFGFALDAATARAARQLAPHLDCISAERIQEELAKLLTAPQPGAYLEPAVLAVVLPELTPAALDAAKPVVDACPAGEENLPVRWAALLGVLGETDTRRVLKRLRCSNTCIEETTVLVRETAGKGVCRSFSEDRPLGWDPAAAGSRAGDGMACNSNDRRQWRKQEVAVGAAASRMRVLLNARSIRWVPQPVLVSEEKAPGTQAAPYHCMTSTLLFRDKLSFGGTQRMQTYTTQMDAARKGIITPEMEIVAKKEYRTTEEIRQWVAEGKVAIPANKHHKCLNPEGVGSMLRTKINVNLGVSRDCKDYNIEMQKVMSAVNMGAEAIMDLSSHGNTQPFRQKLTHECPVMIGTVPVYDSVIHYQRDLAELTAQDFIDVVRLHAEDGVDFVTLHCGITRKTIEQIRKHKRKMNIVSRGGSLVFAWMSMTGNENPFYEHFDEICEICAEHDVTISLGDACRPGCLADATDVCQIEELVRLGELTKRAWAHNVQVMVEGPGHVPLNQVAANMEVQKSICMGAPFYVLGPLVTDVAPGYDHITAAIGGAVAAASGAAFLCYVTPAEHLALPNVEDVKQGIVASKIAAHAADIAKGIPHARDIDDKMGDARRVLDWDAQFACALDPETAKAIRDARLPEDDHSDTCSMCGKFCAVRSMNKALAGEYIDIL